MVAIPTGGYKVDRAATVGPQILDALVLALLHRAEAAVVGFPHALKGQGVYAYLVLQPDADITERDALHAAANAACRQQIGAHARIDLVQLVPGLPKTRSGKVMRRILRKVAEGQPDQLGDVSTLADPSVVASIVAGARSLS